MGNNIRDIYLEWRRKKARLNIIIIFIILIMVYFCVGSFLVNKSKDETADLKQKFSIAVKTYNEKNIPLKTDIINKCISGKKAIIVNGIIYYAGDINTWGDIKGVNCE